MARNSLAETRLETRDVGTGEPRQHPAPGHAPAVTLAICTNRPEQYLSLITANAAALSPSDKALCIVDSVLLPGSTTIASLAEANVETVQHHRTLGLSASRNCAVALCPTRYILFVDDDAAISADLLDATRTAFLGGADAVGARILPAPDLSLNFWFLGYGQYHYLGLHRPDRPISPWGACMGFDVEFARRFGLCFQQDLGRNGSQLGCGEDTSFLRAIRECGGRLDMLESVSCDHHISQERTSLRYLLRRVMWQGRSEVRRRQAWAGLLKEIGRNFDGVGRNPAGIMLGILYVGAVLVGILVGIVVDGRRAAPRHV